MEDEVKALNKATTVQVSDTTMMTKELKACIKGKNILNYKTAKYQFPLLWRGVGVRPY
jgi:hypothetical protein